LLNFTEKPIHNNKSLNNSEVRPGPSTKKSTRVSPLIFCPVEAAVHQEFHSRMAVTDLVGRSPTENI